MDCLMKLSDVTSGQEGAPNRIFTNIDIRTRKEEIHHVFEAWIPSHRHVSKQTMIGRFERYVFQQSYKRWQGPELHGTFQVLGLWQVCIIHDFCRKREEIVRGEL